MYNCVTRFEMVVETSVLSPFKHLTRLLARKVYYTVIYLVISFCNVLQILQKSVHKTFYTITLRNFVVPTLSIWYVILFRETGVVHRIT